MKIPMRRSGAALLAASPFILSLFSSVVCAQNDYSPTNFAQDIANMHEDIRVLDERTRALQVDLEGVKRDNQALKDQLSKQADGLVTLSQMNQAIQAEAQKLRADDAQNKREIISQVTKQIERLAKQTQAAIDSLAKGMQTRSTPAVQTHFSKDYPKTGVTYTVQHGDTLSSIATKFGSSIRDIQNANQIADPTRLQVGQTLFIPKKK